MRAIRQNLSFSLGVLAIAVLLIIVGVLTPVTGALLHELSSIPVIVNSARLIAAGTFHENQQRGSPQSKPGKVSRAFKELIGLDVFSGQAREDEAYYHWNGLHPRR